MEWIYEIKFELFGWRICWLKRKFRGLGYARLWIDRKYAPGRYGHVGSYLKDRQPTPAGEEGGT